jgi:hypothetical protein
MGEREVVSRIAGGLVDREGEGRESRWQQTPDMMTRPTWDPRYRQPSV